MAEEKPFDKFQLEEYKNISNAHFESVKQISGFFRYYLIILAAPVFLLSLVAKKNEGIGLFLEGKEIPIFYDFVFAYFLSVAWIGYFIFIYVVNLRLDVILYARTVNKVRKYFYESSELKIEDYDKYLHLPIVSTKPKYLEKTFFAPILFLFSIINCGFLLAAFALKGIGSKYFFSWPLADMPISILSVSILTGFFFILHIASYYVLAKRMNNYHLKNYLIGIDIDGVLNYQTLHFASWLKKMRGIELDITKLKEIPVSLNSGIGVNDIDEKIVFNTREYWESLPQKEGASLRVNDFQKRFGYNIVFYSYRDWPQYGAQEDNIKNEIKSQKLTPLESGDISKITSEWLKKNDMCVSLIDGYISYLKYLIRINLFRRNTKNAFIELGNPYISDTRFGNNFRKKMLNRNRFQGANTNGFRFFIEDNPENAIKLSGLCDYVFMFNEPYNGDSNYSFPKNVIRVNNWNEIYHHMKILS